MCRPASRPRADDVSGRTHRSAPTREGETFRSQQDRCKTQPSPAGRGRARPLQWGPEPDGRGGAPSPPGFPGLMEAAKDSVGADLCVGPWADPGRMTCPGGHTGPPLRGKGNIPEPTGSVQNAAFPGGVRSPAGVGLASRPLRGHSPSIPPVGAFLTPKSAKRPRGREPAGPLGSFFQDQPSALGASAAAFSAAALAAAAAFSA